jgi:hypothetical protein
MRRCRSNVSQAICNLALRAINERINKIQYPSVLPLLHQQKMHCSVRNYYKSARKHGETDNIFPQSQVIKAKCAENGGTGYFNVEAVFMIDQSQISGFIDDQGFEAIMEDG